ncbi:MAG: competence/damage-inducible protein A [Solirubrobacteraceae bacterium]
MIRAGLLITGTEVLTGAVSDRNGPWLAQRLQERGVQVAQIATVGDRPDDLRAALSMMEGQSLRLIVTSGGLGPTADDLTVATVAEHLGLELLLDDALRERIASIVSRLARRSGRSRAAFEAGNSKQARIPAGAIAIDPVGTAPGLVISPSKPGGAVVVVLPGPPRELQPMWRSATEIEPLAQLLASAGEQSIATMRLFGVPESLLAQSQRDAEAAGVRLEELEVTTCQHRGELEITTRVPAQAADAYADFERFLAERHGEALFSTDGASVDERVATLLRGRFTLTVAESCTGGMLAARLTDVPGSSEYFRGGVVAYENEVKIGAVGVRRELIEAHGAVSEEVAAALASGVAERLGSDVGLGVTGVAGPGGGTEEKPVGLVWLAVSGPRDARETCALQLPGGRPEIRERAVTVAMHMLRVVLEDA